MRHNIRVPGQAKDKILSKLPYERGWLDTQINQWVVSVHNRYHRTKLH
jgi:hypothetical protein